MRWDVMHQRALALCAASQTHGFDAVTLRGMQPFRIHKVCGDNVACFVEAAKTLDAANLRIQELAEFWPGDYLIAVEDGPRADLSRPWEMRQFDTLAPPSRGQCRSSLIAVVSVGCAT